MNEIRIVWFCAGFVVGSIVIGLLFWRTIKKVMDTNAILEHNEHVESEQAKFWKNYYYQEKHKWENE